jgi:hypothetical protein
MSYKLAAAWFALALISLPAMADAAKPNDAEIAHIAQMAGQIDILAAELALQKFKNKGGPRLRLRTWFATIARSTNKLWRWSRSCM